MTLRDLQNTNHFLFEPKSQAMITQLSCRQQPSQTQTQTQLLTVNGTYRADKAPGVNPSEDKHAPKVLNLFAINYFLI